MPDKLGLYSIKEIFHEISNYNIKPIYLLMGNDAYLQSFFLTHLAELINKEKISKSFYSFEEDPPEMIFNEIFAVSLFSDFKFFIIRGLKKIKKNHINDLIAYYKISNPQNCIILIKNEFDLKNSIIKTFKKEFKFIDTRTPFPNKIREWINYILKIEKIILSESNLIDDKIISLNNKEYPIWKLMDSIGNRDLNKSYKIYNSLYRNNISLNQIIFNLNNLFQGIFWLKLREKNINEYGLNYFIKKKLNQYSKQFTVEEIKKNLLELRIIDYKNKSLSLSELDLFIPYIIKTCGSINE